MLLRGCAHEQGATPDVWPSGNSVVTHVGAFDPVHLRLLLFPLSIPQLGPGHHGGNKGCACAASAGGSSRSPLATILSMVFGRGRCSLPASSHGARIHTSH